MDKPLCCTVNPLYICHICADGICEQHEEWGICSSCTKKLLHDPTYGKDMLYGGRLIRHAYRGELK